LQLRPGRLLRRLELPCAEREHPPHGLRRRHQAHGRHVRAPVKYETSGRSRTQSGQFEFIPSSTSLDLHSGTRPVPGLLVLSAPTEHRTVAHNPSTRDHEGKGKDVVGRRPGAARTKVEPLGICLTHEPETDDENDDPLALISAVGRPRRVAPSMSVSIAPIPLMASAARRPVDGEFPCWVCASTQRYETRPPGAPWRGRLSGTPNAVLGPLAACPDNPFIRGAHLDGSRVLAMAGEELILATVLAIILIVVILRAAVKVVREYERLVIFRLGRLLAKPKGPGLTWIIPIFDRRVLIDLRTVAFDVPRQRVVSRDNVSVEVDAVVYYRVYGPLKAVTEVQNYIQATNLLAQTTLRDVLGQVELDELLSKREELSKRIQILLDTSTEPWGIKVSAVTLRDVSLPDTMVRAIAKQAEAERERRSRVIMAEGEFQAAEKMREAAMIYGCASSMARLTVRPWIISRRRSTRPAVAVMRPS